MIQKSIKIAIRRLITLKVYSSINIGGLAIAISVCLAILLYATFHLSFDKYIPNGENTYRLISRYGDGSFYTNTFACFSDVLSDFPEVESYTICYDNHNIEEVFVGENKIKVDDAIFVNDSFFDFFGIKMIRGNKMSVNESNTVMLTEGMAKKLFPEKDAIGQTLWLRSFTRNQDSLIAYSIKGIVDALPKTSHIQYEMLLSQSGHFSPTVETVKSRKVFGGLIYVKTFVSTNINDIEKRLQNKIEPILGGKHGPPLEAINHKLQAVYDIHTTQGINNESQPTVRRSSLNILLLVGFLIFTIAILNSVIIHIARTTFNGTSTLIIRFHGGTKMNLFRQTVIEVFISVSLSFILVLFVLSGFKLLLDEQFFTGWNISFQSYEFGIIFFSLFLVVSVVISILSSLNLLRSETILKEATRPRGIKVAIPLVIFQFVMVISLIGFALLLNTQMNFIEKKELGYSSENVVVIRIPQVNEKVHVFRNELMKIPGIKNAGTAHHYPGYRFQDMTFTNGNNSFPFIFGYIDQDAIQTLKIKPIKYFTEFKEKSSEGWMINESFYNQLKSEYTEEQIAMDNFPKEKNQSDENTSSEFKVLGVMGDFHYASFHSKIENFAFYIRDPGPRYNRFVLARYEQNKTREVISAIENKMEEFYPGQPINYSFLDDQINFQYASEELLMKLINTFSFLAIFIASLGLMGLSIFMTEKRTKEIGIRKVNGSSVYEIVKMLSIVFIKWVGFAFVIATPITYYATQQWLQNFAYTTQLSWWIFILAGLVALIIVLITVSWQTFKVARRNPVEALRYE